MANIANIEAALEKLQAGGLPVSVCAWRVEAGPDWSDDPAVWVWIVLESEEVEDAEVPALLELQDIVYSRVGGVIDDDSLLYVRFTGPPESGRAR